jgi:hypothetical protein
MRKLFLVVLVLLAAAALGFAQDAAGTVTWSGEARIGAEANFSKDGSANSDGKIEKNDPTVYANDDRYGQVTFSYDKGAFNGEVYARGIYNDGNGIDGYVGILGEYGDGVNGDTETPYKVNANVRFLTAPLTLGMSALMEDTDGDGKPDAQQKDDQNNPLFSYTGSFFAIEKLYGYYLFADKQLKLDVAYKGYETIYWRVSDLVASAWDNLDGKIGLAVNFKPAAVEGLSAGIAYSQEGNAIIENLRAKNTPQLFEDVLMSTVIGAKYDVSPIAVSLMLQLGHDGLDKSTRANLGFKYQISDALHAQTDWQFALTGVQKDSDADSYAYLRGGARVEYNSAPLHAGLNIKLTDAGDDFKILPSLGDTGGLWFDSDEAKQHNSYLQINPYVYYDLIKDALQVRLPVTLGLDIAPEVENAGVVTHKSGSGSGLIIAPALYWNLAGDKVTDDPGRGILVDYKIGLAFDEDYTKSHDDRGDFINKLGIRFRWNF